MGNSAWCWAAQAFEQDLLRQEQMMRAGSGSVRQVDFDPVGDPYMQGPSHPRRNSSREDLTLVCPMPSAPPLQGRKRPKEPFELKRYHAKCSCAEMKGKQ